MNIFYLSEDPLEAAQMMVDRHVVKMILESAQLLSTAHRILDGEEVVNVVNNRKKNNDNLSLSIGSKRGIESLRLSSLWKNKSNFKIRYPIFEFQKQRLFQNILLQIKIFR